LVNRIVQLNLYFLLRELARDDLVLLGVKLINDGKSYILGVSWQDKDENHYRNFHNLSVAILKQFYLPKIISIRPDWQVQLDSWGDSPSKIVSLGRLRPSSLNITH